MNRKKPKIIVICGPTSSGKSDAAIRLAQTINGEIISVDSRQIFSGMDLGTGKVNGQWDKKSGTYISENIPHYLIDVVDPMQDFNVSHFKKLARVKIEEILSHKKVPIICGGTGFWISALVDNVSLPEVEPNEKLRSSLRCKTTDELFKKLRELDPERAENIDSKNPVRLIRAIEIALALGSVPKINNEKKNTTYDFLQIGIEIPKEELDQKIKKRLEERFDQGMIQEVEGLLEKGVSPEWLEKIGLEYRWISRYLQEKIGLEEMKKKLYFDIIHYAKRQMTWLRKDPRILWMKDYSEIETAAKKFLQ